MYKTFKKKKKELVSCTKWKKREGSKSCSTDPRAEPGWGGGGGGAVATKAIHLAWGRNMDYTRIRCSRWHILLRAEDSVHEPICDVKYHQLHWESNAVKPLVKREQGHFEHSTTSELNWPFASKRRTVWPRISECLRKGRRHPSQSKSHRAGSWIRHKAIPNHLQTKLGERGEETSLAKLKHRYQLCTGDSLRLHRWFSLWKQLWSVFLHRHHVSIKGKNKKDKRMKMSESINPEVRSIQILLLQWTMSLFYLQDNRPEQKDKMASMKHHIVKRGSFRGRSVGPVFRECSDARPCLRAVELLEKSVHPKCSAIPVGMFHAG